MSTTYQEREEAAKMKNALEAWLLDNTKPFPRALLSDDAQLLPFNSLAGRSVVEVQKIIDEKRIEAKKDVVNVQDPGSTTLSGEPSAHAVHDTTHSSLVQNPINDQAVVNDSSSVSRVEAFSQQSQSAQRENGSTLFCTMLSVAAFIYAIQNYAMGAMPSANQMILRDDALSNGAQDLIQISGIQRSEWEPVLQIMQQYRIPESSLSLQNERFMLESFKNIADVGRALMSIYQAIPEQSSNRDPQHLLQYIQSQLTEKLQCSQLTASVLAQGSFCMWCRANGVRSDVLDAATLIDGQSLSTDVVIRSGDSVDSQYLALASLAFTIGTALHLSGGHQISSVQQRRVVDTSLNYWNRIGSASSLALDGGEVTDSRVEELGRYDPLPVNDGADHEHSSCHFTCADLPIAPSQRHGHQLELDQFSIGYGNGQAQHSVEWNRDEKYEYFSGHQDHINSLNHAVQSGFMPTNIHVTWRNSDTNQLPASYWAGVNSFLEAEKYLISNHKNRALHLNDCKDKDFFHGCCDVIRSTHGDAVDLSRYLSNYSDLVSKFPDEQSNRLDDKRRKGALKQYMAAQQVKGVSAQDSDQCQFNPDANLTLGS